MAAYEFQAQDAAGKTSRGVLQGDSPKTVRSLLRERGLTPLEVTEVREKQAPSVQSGQSFLSTALFQRGLSNAELAILTRQFAVLIRAGLPLDEVLQTLAEQSENDSAKRMLLAIRGRMLEGSNLAAALGEFPKTFDALYCASIAAGEQSGHLDTVLERLADYCENSAGLAQKLTLALVYPALLGVVAVAITTGLLGVVVPQVAQVFVQADRELPFMTRLMLGLSGLVTQYGAIAFISGIFGAIVFAFGLRNAAFKLRWHQLLLRIPVLGPLIRGTQAARFARTMAISTSASVPVLEAIKLSSQVVSHLPMRKALGDVYNRVREGTPLSIALRDTKEFPKILVRLTGSGEKSGALEPMLDHASELIERQVQSKLTAFVALLEPGMILVMGLMVLAIVLAILQPILEMNTLLGGAA
jgi:general secretion pathway protein F